MSTTRLKIPFRSPEGGSGALMWAQREMWETLRRLPPEDTGTNMQAILELPPGTTLDALAAALRAVLERHDSLHTLFFEGCDGGGEGGEPDGGGDRADDAEPRQHVVQSGVLDFAVHAWDPATASDLDRYAAEVSERQRDRRFDLRAQLPFRACAITADGRPVRLALAFSHLAVDVGSMRIVGEDLRALLAGVPPPPPGRSPLARAAYEAGPQMRRRAEKALRYWLDRFEAVPRELVERLPEGDAPRPNWTRLSSPALACAVPALAARHGITDSIAVHALTGLLLALRTGAGSSALQIPVTPRFEPEDARLVAAFNQRSLCRMEVRAESVGEFLDRAGIATIAAYRNAQYPPHVLDPALAEVCRRRGFEAGSYCVFNDIRPLPRLAPRHPADRPPTRTRLAAMLAETQVLDLAGDPFPHGARFFLFLESVGGAFEAKLGLDPAFLPPWTPADFLLAWESLLLTAALAPDTPVSALAAVFAPVHEKGPAQRRGG